MKVNFYEIARQVLLLIGERPDAMLTQNRETVLRVMDKLERIRESESEFESALRLLDDAATDAERQEGRRKLIAIIEGEAEITGSVK